MAMDTSIGLANLLDPDLYQDRFFQHFFPLPAANNWPMGIQTPDFELMDGVGDRPVTLSAYRQQPVVLAFTRIFTQRTVCPFCSPHIKALNDGYAQFREAGIALVMISSLTAAEGQRFAQAFGMQMPFLCDPTGQVFRAYHTGQALGAPLPAQFVLDSQGHLRYRHLFSFLDHNASVETLLAQAGRAKFENGM
jgi:peroxiredoxin